MNVDTMQWNARKSSSKQDNHSASLTYKLRGGTNDDDPVLCIAANLRDFEFG